MDPLQDPSPCWQDTCTDLATSRTRVAEAGSRARVWRGSEVPTDQQGMKVLGKFMGYDECVCRLLEKFEAKQQTVGSHPHSARRQSAWLCSSTAPRANHHVRVVRPRLVESFAESHDQGLWQCLCAILEVSRKQLR